MFAFSIDFLRNNSELVSLLLLVLFLHDYVTLSSDFFKENSENEIGGLIEVRWCTKAD